MLLLSCVTVIIIIIVISTIVEGADANIESCD